MNIQTEAQSNHYLKIVWYKVPIVWFMLALLSTTVVAGVSMFILAHHSNDSVVIEKNNVPLNKKQGMPQSQVDSRSRFKVRLQNLLQQA